MGFESKLRYRGGLRRYNFDWLEVLLESREMRKPGLQIPAYYYHS